MCLAVMWGKIPVAKSLQLLNQHIWVDRGKKMWINIREFPSISIRHAMVKKKKLL